MGVFGAGCALAALAGVIGGITFVTEPSMAAVMGSIVFVVVVVGGMGSLAGAFVGSIAVGLLQTLPLMVDGSLASLLNRHGAAIGPGTPGWPLLRITLAQSAPILPYLLLVLVLVFRPRGLLGKREG
jgi:branched-chain amino acid transport system permease protein